MFESCFLNDFSFPSLLISIHNIYILWQARKKPFVCLSTHIKNNINFRLYSSEPIILFDMSVSPGAIWEKRELLCRYSRQKDEIFVKILFTKKRQVYSIKPLVCRSRYTKSRFRNYIYYRVIFNSYMFPYIYFSNYFKQLRFHQS